MKIGDHAWLLVIDCEEKKSDAAGKQQINEEKNRHNITQDDNTIILENIQVTDIKDIEISSLYDVKEEKILFQEDTQSELNKDLIQDASTFSTWQEFYEFQ